MIRLQMKPAKESVGFKCLGGWSQAALAARPCIRGWSQAALAARLCCLLDFRPFHLLHSAVFGIAENCVMRWRNAHLAWMHGIRCVPQGLRPCGTHLDASGLTVGQARYRCENPAVRTWMRAGCAAADQPRPNSAFAALNQAPKARLATFGIENRLTSPKPDRLLRTPSPNGL